MGRYIVKLEDQGVDYYLEYSTVVDAPVTYGMTLNEFKAYYKDQYGREGMRNLQERLDRVTEIGTSSRIDDSVDEVFSCNRAGVGETKITKEEIIEIYIRQRPPNDKNDEVSMKLGTLARAIHASLHRNIYISNFVECEAESWADKERQATYIEWAEKLVGLADAFEEGDEAAVQKIGEAIETERRKRDGDKP